MAGIKTLELDPTRENIYNTLVANAVGRNKALWRFACFCSAQESRCSIAIDGGWGTGKTFFLRQLEMLFDACGDQKEQLKDEERNAIRKLFFDRADDDSPGMTIQSHACVYYDAWLNDSSEDPLHSILYELLKQTKAKFRKNRKMKCWKTACGLFDAITGRNTTNLLELEKETNPVSDIENQKSFHDALAEFLNNLIPSGKGRLLVLIDELDRCKPTYAVQLLERIKHYLSNDKITFVFAVNEEQLQYTIKAFYGDGFDAYHYLNRFFDFRLPLPKPDMTKINNRSEIRIKNAQIRMLNSVCNAFVEFYQMNLRDAARFWLWVKIVCCSFLYNEEIKQDPSWKLIVFVVMPIVLGLKIHDKELFDKFMNGMDEAPLRNIVERSLVAKKFIDDHDRNPTIKNKEYGKNGVFPELFDTTKSIYQRIFGRNNTGISLPPQTSFAFDKEMIAAIYQAPGLMADFILYDTNTEETARG